jgi:hypothetical protein
VVVLCDDDQILLLGVVGLFELRKDDGQEEVEHDVGNHERKELEERLGTSGAAAERMPTYLVLLVQIFNFCHVAWLAVPHIVLRQPHAQLLHDRVPGFASHAPEESDETARKVHEISVFVVL